MTGERAARSGGASFADQAFAVAAEAFTSTSESWEHSIQAAIAHLFEFLTREADQTKACIVADCGAGSAALTQRDRTIERFTQLLQPGFQTAAPRPPPVVAEAIAGGIYELVRGHVLERRLGELPAAAPDATVVALSPFIGADDATALASSTKVQANR